MGQVTNRFPELFRQYMEANKGKTQQQVAKEWGVPASLISRYKRGHVSESFNMELLSAACQHMGVTPNDILWDETEATS